MITGRIRADEAWIRLRVRGLRGREQQIDALIDTVAGFRVLDNLAWGRFLYVDDLVTLPACRSQGYGANLLAWLRERAVQENCDQLHLDSGIQRKDAAPLWRMRRLVRR